MPKKVIEWALRKKFVLERLVQAVMSMYKGAKTRVHQRSVLSPFLFLIVLDVLS